MYLRRLFRLQLCFYLEKILNEENCMKVGDEYIYIECFFRYIPIYSNLTMWNCKLMK